MRVFVTDGDNRAALAVTRSLGRAGHDVIVGEKRSPALAQTSRYCAGRVTYPDPAVASEAFVDTIVDVVSTRRIDVLIPVADITTFLVIGQRERFACAVPVADAEATRRAADKVDMVVSAKRLGVPVPRFVIVAHPAHIPAIDFGYPLVIKPRQSRVRTAAGWVSSAVSYAQTPEALAADLAGRPAHEFPLMVQERIVGPGVGVFACYHHGKPIALFSHRRLRERPPWGGVSVLSESVPLCARAKDYAVRLLDELQWQGVAMVEFKLDEHDGQPKLMEINGRFWGSLQLAIDAGVDFPALVVRTVEPNPIEPLNGYRIGVKNRWLWGDVDSLLVTLLGRNAGGRKWSRSRAVLDFLKLWGRDLSYENPKLDDMSPFFFESVQWLRRGARDLARRALPIAAPHAALVPVTAPRAARITTARSIAETGLDEGAWNDLVARSETNSIFQTLQWHRSWCAAYSADCEKFIVTVADGMGISGVAPLMIRQSWSGDRVLSFIGDGRSDYCDFLTRGDRPQVLRQLFEAVHADMRWDILQLHNIPAESTTAPIFADFCKQVGYHVIVRDQFLCPTLLVEGHEEAAGTILNKPSLRRPINRLRRLGRLQSRMLTSAEEIEPHLEPFFNQHVRRWGGRSTQSMFSNPVNRTFYRELTASLGPTGWLQFLIVELDGHAVAYHYGFDYNSRVIWYKPSYSLDFAAYSPGMVLVRDLIAYAVERHKRELDFTIGDEAFKRRFTNHVRKTVTLRVFRRQSRHLLELSREGLTGVVRKIAR